MLKIPVFELVIKGIRGKVQIKICAVKFDGSRSE